MAKTTRIPEDGPEPPDLMLHPKAVEAPRAHKAAQAKHALKAGALLDREAGLVFRSKARTIVRASNLLRRLRPVEGQQAEATERLGAVLFGGDES